MIAGIWAILAGCSPLDPHEPPLTVEPVPPAIAKLSVDCDVEDGAWTLQVDATAWVGEASTDWTVDGMYVEVHRMDSVAYERDGSFERLRLVAAIVADWRKQDRGKTAFLCADPVDILVTITDLDGEVADCRAVGPRPERWADIEGTGTCDVPWSATTE